MVAPEGSIGSIVCVCVRIVFYSVYTIDPFMVKMNAELYVVYVI